MLWEFSHKINPYVFSRLLFLPEENLQSTDYYEVSSLIFTRRTYGSRGQYQLHCFLCCTHVVALTFVCHSKDAYYSWCLVTSAVRYSYVHEFKFDLLNEVLECVTTIPFLHKKFLYWIILVVRSIFCNWAIFAFWTVICFPCHANWSYFEYLFLEFNLCITCLASETRNYKLYIVLLVSFMSTIVIVIVLSSKIFDA